MDNELYAQCQAQMPSLMPFWEEIVNTDSGSGDSHGLRHIAAILEDKLKPMGFAITRIPSTTPDLEYSIVATRTGTGSKSVLLMAHMDTVFPAGTAAERPFTIKGDWAHGPGVSDCKAGIAAMIAIAKLLQPGDYKTITLLFNCDEEIGSPSSKATVVTESKKHDYVFSYEPGGPGDGLAIARKGNGRIKVETFGKNSHAGTNPEKGINAMAELVWQVNRMLNLGDAAKKTTVVFTKIVCGDRVNVVPDHGEAWADVRVSLPEELNRLEQDLQRLSSERLLPDSRVEATLIRSRPPFPENDITNKLSCFAQKIYNELGLTLGAESVGGVGDINYAYGSGAACLCRMASPSGGPNHCAEENNYIPAIVPRLYLSVRMIRELCGKQS